MFMKEPDIPENFKKLISSISSEVLGTKKEFKIESKKKRPSLKNKFCEIHYELIKNENNELLRIIHPKNNQPSIQYQKYWITLRTVPGRSVKILFSKILEEYLVEKKEISEIETVIVLNKDKKILNYQDPDFIKLEQVLYSKLTIPEEIRDQPFLA
jgi:hypothetical protein